MKIVLTGVETNNKGAELMLYAILQEVERRHPNAEVYIEPVMNRQGLDYVHTKVKLRYWPLENFVNKTHLNGIFSRLHLPLKWLKDTRAVKADYLLDGSGFCFSDQCGMWGRKADWWEAVLKRQYDNGAKIVFLPQAFGPLEQNDTKDAMRVLDKYASLIMPRERVSYDYLRKSGLVDMQKVHLYPDFTSVVEGTFPKRYEHLRGGICIIPNQRMIDKGKTKYNDYISLLSAIILEGKKSGHLVYLLNHEGKDDADLCLKCKESIGSDIEVVLNLNALEVKGLIASAYMVVTSRFHGAASALNTCVPCLATSWSHKYQELFNDYGMDDGVLPVNDLKKTLSKIREYINIERNAAVRAKLAVKVPQIKEETRQMWGYVWSLIS